MSSQRSFVSRGPLCGNDDRKMFFDQSLSKQRAPLRADDLKFRGHARFVHYLDQERSPAALDKFGRSFAARDFHARFRIDIDFDKRVLVEQRFDFVHRRRRRAPLSIASRIARMSPGGRVAPW